MSSALAIWRWESADFSSVPGAGLGWKRGRSGPTDSREAGLDVFTHRPVYASSRRLCAEPENAHAKDIAASCYRTTVAPCTYGQGPRRESVEVPLMPSTGNKAGGCNRPPEIARVFVS